LNTVQKFCNPSKASNASNEANEANEDQTKTTLPLSLVDDNQGELPDQ